MAPRNQGQPWYDADEKIMVRWFLEGQPTAEIAAWLGRSVTAIECRLGALGYDPTRKPALAREEVKSMSKAPNRYLVLGVRQGHVRRLASRRGYTPDEAVQSALLVDEISAKGSQGANDCLILVEIQDASDDIGEPLNTWVRVIERETPVPPYRLVSLNRQTR